MDWTLEAKDSGVWQDIKLLTSYLDDVHSDMDEDIKALKEGNKTVLRNCCVIEAIEDIAEIEQQINKLRILEYCDMLAYRYEDSESCGVIGDIQGYIDNNL